jgi:hypothetical protein
MCISKILDTIFVSVERVKIFLWISIKPLMAHSCDLLDTYSSRVFTNCENFFSKIARLTMVPVNCPFWDSYLFILRCKGKCSANLGKDRKILGKQDFLKLFGFGFEHVDYDADAPLGIV